MLQCSLLFRVVDDCFFRGIVGNMGAFVFVYIPNVFGSSRCGCLHRKRGEGA